MNFWFWDAWLIAKCEEFAHWFQRWTGKTNYFLCKVCSWTIIVTLIVEYAATKLLRGESVGTFTAYAIFVLLLDVSYLIPYEERHAFERMKKGVANPEKVAPGDRFFRFCFTATILFSSVFFVGALLFAPLSKLAEVSSGVYFSTIFGITGIFFRLYFAACDPLPPCKGRVWDVIGAFFAKPAMIEKET